MPNLTVKKYDGTTDIAWAQTQTGGSDSSRPAIWQSQSVGTAQSHRPELRYYVRRGNNGAKTAAVFTGHYPVLSVDTTTGITSVLTRQKLKVEFEIDNSYNQTDVNEFVAQMINLLDHATVVDLIRLQVTVNS